MDDIEILIKEGKRQVSNNKLSKELVSKIENLKHGRSYISEIFAQEFILYENQNLKTKARRKILFQLKSSFSDYLYLFEKYNVTVLLLFPLGLVVVISSILKLNSNLLFGVITLLEASILFGISLNNKFSRITITPTIIIFLYFYAIEFYTLGIPKPLLEEMNGEVFDIDNGLLVVINFFTPTIYIIVKLSALSLLVYFLYKKISFFVKLKQFNNNK